MLVEELWSARIPVEPIGGSSAFGTSVLSWQRALRKGRNSKAVTARFLPHLLIRLLGIQQRRAKLLGLDAPQQIDVSVLKTATDQSGNGAAKEQQMLDRLSSEDKRVFLDLISKMSGDRGRAMGPGETTPDKAVFNFRCCPRPQAPNHERISSWPNTVAALPRNIAKVILPIILCATLNFQ